MIFSAAVSRDAVDAQVKVWLGENLSHYYVLSRFLISRMLTVTKIKHTKVGQACWPGLSIRSAV